MNKILVCLVAALAGAGVGAGATSPALAQDAVALAAGPVIIAPPQTPLAQTIKSGLGAVYYSAARDSTA